MHAVIIAVGDELTSGAVVDTNSAYLAARLGELGIETVRHETVGDDVPALIEAISRAAAQAELVIITGGLGPTPDDLTRQALASALGTKLVEDPRQARRIEEFFSRRGRQMKPSNRAQALVPRGAEAIDNDCGTAPGLTATVGKARLFVLPGPPHEMRQMFTLRVLPELSAETALATRLVHTFGAGESDVAEAIADLMDRRANPRLGTTAQAGVVTVRITARGPDAQAAERLAEKTAELVRARLGELAFGADGETLPAVVGSLLRSAGQTLAVAESCTGGLLGALLTETPGASEYFLGGVVAYANEAKACLLDVPQEMLLAHGAVSEPVAEHMAAGARRCFGAEWGIGLTGIAGPTGGSKEKPLGLVYIAVAGPRAGAVHRHVFPGTREVVRRRAALAALNHLRLALKRP
ncbi:MAG: competence/damage-inducible protein A [Planctomycetales bacterium 4484_123]|nr:MAG: competence/damage-inducible protein A [Planctomycetales bacterium 4484_123]